MKCVGRDFQEYAAQLRWHSIFEPGHAAWKAAVIAIRPPTHKAKIWIFVYKFNCLSQQRQSKTATYINLK